MIAAPTPKIFNAGDLARPAGRPATADDIGQPVEFWLVGRTAGASGHLVNVFDDTPLLDFGGPVGVVVVARIGRFAMPLDCISVLPVDPSPAGILPPSGASPRAPDGGSFSGGAQHA